MAVAENFLAVGGRLQRPLEAVRRPWAALQEPREMGVAETRPAAVERLVAGQESVEEAPVHHPRQCRTGLASPAAGGGRRETVQQSLARQASAAGMAACRADREAAETPGDRPEGGTQTAGAEAAVPGGLARKSRSVSSEAERKAEASVCTWKS